MLPYWLFPPPLTMYQRNVNYCLPMAMNSGTAFRPLSVIGIGSITFLSYIIKGMPYGVAAFSLRLRILEQLRLFFLFQMVSCIRYRNVDVHGYKLHMQILLLPDTDFPLPETHTN